MTFISREQANRIAQWNKKHPKEAEEFQKWHREQYELLMAKKITLKEFCKRHEEYREKLPE